MRNQLYQVLSLFIFVASMLALFTGVLAIFPEPLFPADQVVRVARDFCFWVFGTNEEVVPYFGNILAAFLMFTITALLGDLVDLISKKRDVAKDGKSFEYLMRFLYCE